MRLIRLPNWSFLLKLNVNRLFFTETRNYALGRFVALRSPTTFVWWKVKRIRSTMFRKLKKKKFISFHPFMANSRWNNRGAFFWKLKNFIALVSNYGELTQWKKFFVSFIHTMHAKSLQKWIKERYLTPPPNDSSNVPSSRSQRWTAIIVQNQPRLSIMKIKQTVFDFLSSNKYLSSINDTASHYHYRNSNHRATLYHRNLQND